MKKTARLISVITLAVMLIHCFSACSITKNYQGKEIAKLTYETVVYYSGYTDTYVLDFVGNKYYSASYLHSVEEATPEPELKTEFTEEEEKVFINACYTHGLFDLDEHYELPADDGGGWKLVIEYSDGSTKLSTGSNFAPYSIFNKCSTAFYDLCREHVLGNLPSYYAYPPNISYSFNYSPDEKQFVSSNGLAEVKRADYKWNKSASADNDIYAINEKLKEKNEFVSDFTYRLVLYTANYDYKERFKTLTLKEYDYSSELSNEKMIYSGKWIKQIELDIELNKIYVYELTFKNGDYVQYTFNTCCAE